MIELDSVDRKILFELDRDSRQPISQLARIIKRGRDQVEYHVEKLIEQKIIRQFVPSINPYKLGYTLYKVNFRLENRKARIGEFLIYLQKHPRIYWLALCDGGWDLVVVLFARSAFEFHDIHTHILSKFTDVVLDFNAYTLVEYKSYARRYFTGSNVSVQRGVGGKPEKLEIDKTDFRILRLLAKDARISTVAIGAKVDLTHQAVQERIKRLERLEIINGYRIEIDLGKLGLLFFKTQFYLRSYDIALREELISFCDRSPHIISYIEQVGDCNIEIEMEVNNYEQYSEIIDTIRGENSKLVRNFQTMLIQKANRYAVPEDLEEGIE